MLRTREGWTTSSLDMKSIKPGAGWGTLKWDLQTRTRFKKTESWSETTWKATWHDLIDPRNPKELITLSTWRNWPCRINVLPQSFTRTLRDCHFCTVEVFPMTLIQGLREEFAAITTAIACAKPVYLGKVEAVSWMQGWMMKLKWRGLSSAGIGWCTDQRITQISVLTRSWRRGLGDPCADVLETFGVVNSYNRSLASQNIFITCVLKAVKQNCRSKNIGTYNTWDDM